MRFLLQQGWGMMTLSNELLQAGVGSGIILSPRVSDPEQLARHADAVRQLGKQVLFDPQFYVPRTSHERIRQFPYWKGSPMTRPHLMEMPQEIFVGESLSTKYTR